MVGIKKGKFYPCPEKHICVSTQAPKNDKKHYIKPIPLEIPVNDALNKIMKIIKSMKGSKILENSKNYIQIQFTTTLLKFKDDVEFYLDEEERLIHFRSQSRMGGYDWNANRKRMEDFRKKYLES